MSWRDDCNKAMSRVSCLGLIKPCNVIEGTTGLRVWGFGFRVYVGEAARTQVQLSRNIALTVHGPLFF